MAARRFEEKVLRKLHLLDPFGPNSKWLNRTTNKSICNHTPYVRTAWHRQQLSINARSRTVSDATKEKISAANKGRKHSDATKQKIANSNKGKTMSASSIAKGVAARAGQTPYWLGKNRSNETKEKLSASRAGKTYEELYGKDIAKDLKEKRKAQMSKRWIVTHPSGLTECITNLKQFSDAHNLNHARMIDIANGKQKTHRGFICKRET